MKKIFLTRSHQIGEPECPSCGAVLNDSTRVTDSPVAPVTPEDGNWTVCLYCAAPLVYGAHGQELKFPSESELAAMEQSSLFQMVLQAAVRLRK